MEKYLDWFDAESTWKSLLNVTGNKDNVDIHV